MRSCDQASSRILAGDFSFRIMGVAGEAAVLCASRPALEFGMEPNVPQLFMPEDQETTAMMEYVGPIEKQTLENPYFRQVLFTGKHAQLVVMCLGPGEEIGDEVHRNVDQFFRIEQGEGKFVFNEKQERLVRDGDAVVVPAGTYHNVINTSKTAPLKLYTLYSPPNHPGGTVHKTRAEAEAAERLEHQGDLVVCVHNRFCAYRGEASQVVPRRGQPRRWHSACSLVSRCAGQSPAKDPRRSLT